jgi:membrane fusion protein (multidrug efflux system)
MTEEKTQGTSKARKIRAYIILTIVVVAVIAAGWSWYKNYTKYYSTDDAYVDADRVAVSSKILGRIVGIHAEEGDTVFKGQLLVEIDSSDLVAQRVQAMAARDQAIASVVQANAKYEFDQKGLKVQEINVEKAKEDLDRATIQYNGKVISKEQFDHISKAYQAAVAQLDASRAQLTVSRAQIESASLAINTASAQIGMIETSLRNTRIFSPSEGRIAKRWLLTGDIVQAGQAVYTVTKDSVKWVTAFYEETKVGGMHVGQQAEYTVDAFAGVKFYGKIFSIGTNTAAQFSLIPANNASGNFTKVTQRIPVKISIDKCDSQDNTMIDRLVSGMSVVIKIYK